MEKPLPPPISVAMLVKNSERYLYHVLNALKDFDEVVLLDNGSTDQTREIASQFPNVSWKEHSFIGFGPMKNLAAQYARNDWILTIDSDEVLPPELSKEIRALSLNPSCVYAIPRLNHYKGRPIKGCGWYPDYVIRLYNKKHTEYNNKHVHEEIRIKKGMRVQKLSNHLLHYTFDSAEELIDKMQQYSTLFANENSHKTASPTKALIRSFLTFIKCFLLKKGLFYGGTGLLISMSNAMGVFYKYMKLYERQTNKGPKDPTKC